MLSQNDKRRRYRIHNRSTGQRPGCGLFQYVYTMDGREICAIDKEASESVVRATVLRTLDLSGPMTDIVQLVQMSASSSSNARNSWQLVLDPSALPEGWISNSRMCMICSGIFGVDNCVLMDDWEACRLCRPMLCCSRCSHMWQSPAIKNDHDEVVEPGTRICALCVTPAMLEAEAAYMTHHFRYVSMAWFWLDR